VGLSEDLKQDGFNNTVNDLTISGNPLRTATTTVYTAVVVRGC
jgi:hypothetical protein